MKDTKAILAAFYDHRDHAIDQLEAGVLTKRAFLESNVAFFQNRGLTPFPEPQHDLDACIFNYQYYNVQAKLLLLEASEEGFRSPGKARRLRDQALDMYNLKDKWTLRILEVHGFEDVEAYMLTTRSESLSGELFEIVLTDRERIILHSMDKRILHRLRRNGAWSDQAQASRITGYVDRRY